MSGSSHLIALDWGTSSLRAALMDAQGKVLEQIDTADGIMSIADQGFESVFKKIAGPWLRDHPDSIVLAAGMIGSRQGWREAPYLPCPAGFQELGDGLVWMQAPDASLGFVPGLSTQHANGLPDVMRGEETQIFGALVALDTHHGIFILPGTHSKWAFVENRRIQRFHTFMTGELFALLRQHSILSRTMSAQDTVPWEQGRASFLAGCALAAQGALLHGLFSVRAQGLFGTLDGALQADYLSGLLIGEEIREGVSLLHDAGVKQVHLVCNLALFERYQAALSVFGINSTACEQQASFRGMFAIARQRGLMTQGNMS